MPSASLVLNDENLVPAARFGAALFRERTGAGTTMAALARESEGRFLPDELVAIERGEGDLDDDRVRALCGIYSLGDRPWSPPSSLELVLDRAPVSDFEAHSPAHPGVDRTASLRWVASRFVALSILLGIDVTSGPVGVGLLAEALEESLDTTIELVGDVLETDAAGIGAMIVAMEGRVAVPEVGFLVAETDAGSLLLVARGAAPEDARMVPACGALGGLLRAAR